MSRVLLGSVVGPPGTQWFTALANMTAAPAGARIGDLVANGSLLTRTVGTRTLNPGQFSQITALSPFTLAPAPFSELPKGQQGIPGPQGPASGDVAHDQLVSFYQRRFFYNNIAPDSSVELWEYGSPLDGWAHYTPRKGNFRQAFAIFCPGVLEIGGYAGNRYPLSELFDLEVHDDEHQNGGPPDYVDQWAHFTLYIEEVRNRWELDVESIRIRLRGGSQIRHDLSYEFWFPGNWPYLYNPTSRPVHAEVYFSFLGYLYR